MPRRTNNKPMPKPPAPKPAAQPPKVPLQQGPSISDSIKQGFSFGIGSAIAHRIFGKTETTAPPVPPAPPQDKIYELYFQCMEKNDKNVNCSDLLL
jgi:hypothetical protein